MSIVLTELLGTDSISGSRVVLNDNFNIIRDEINAIENYINIDSAVIDGLQSIISSELYIGPNGNYNLELDSDELNINIDTNIEGNLNLDGIFSNESITLIDESSFSGTALIEPESGNYSIVHTSTSDFTIQLEDGIPGQEVSFFIEQTGSGDIFITSSGDSTFVLDSSNDTIQLIDVGSTVTMKYILDSTNNGAWYIVGSHAITLI